VPAALLEAAAAAVGALVPPVELDSFPALLGALTPAPVELAALLGALAPMPAELALLLAGLLLLLDLPADVELVLLVELALEVELEVEVELELELELEVELDVELLMLGSDEEEGELELLVLGKLGALEGLDDALGKPALDDEEEDVVWHPASASPAPTAPARHQARTASALARSFTVACIGTSIFKD
jgi:hypothetical protein